MPVAQAEENLNINVLPWIVQETQKPGPPFSWLVYSNWNLISFWVSVWVWHPFITKSVIRRLNYLKFIKKVKLNQRILLKLTVFYVYNDNLAMWMFTSSKILKLPPIFSMSKNFRHNYVDGKLQFLLFVFILTEVMDQIMLIEVA